VDDFAPWLLIDPAKAGRRSRGASGSGPEHGCITASRGQSRAAEGGPGMVDPSGLRWVGAGRRTAGPTGLGVAAPGRKLADRRGRWARVRGLAAG
jgi:hypothetical protein